MDHPSFLRGYRWITAEVWEACNKAIDEHVDEFGRLPPDDGQDIWWNHYLKISDPSDALYMTMERIEERILEEAGKETVD
jgi:hypothetical protein